MTQHTPNRLGRKCFCVCCALSCLLFQLMFCGLFYLFAGYALWFVPDWVLAMNPHEIVSWFYTKSAASENAVAVLCLANMLSLILHLALICYVALRLPKAKDPVPAVEVSSEG